MDARLVVRLLAAMGMDAISKVIYHPGIEFLRALAIDEARRELRKVKKK
jgi:hypothetical protein